MTLRTPAINDMQSVKDELFTYVWDFKHGDNIMYNFAVLRALYAARSNFEDQDILNKPITILLVSVIEAILIDLLARIDQATTHLPANVDRATLDNLKVEIESKKRPEKIEDEFGERIFLRRKMYQFNDIIVLLKKYELFGPQDDSIYATLTKFGHLRNRVHIENYHRNFEDREYKVFTSQRLAELESVLSELWTKMINDYKRPW